MEPAESHALDVILYSADASMIEECLGELTTRGEGTTDP